MKVKQILMIATEVSCRILKYGGEAYRAEETARYICNCYGIQEVDVFAIPTSIVVTIGRGDDFITKARRILKNQVDLTKVDKLNDLSRYICVTQPSFAEVEKRLAHIEAISQYPLPIQTLGYGILSLSFAMMFGGTIFEGMSAFFLGTLVFFAQILMGKANINGFLQTTFSSFLISLLAYSAMVLSGGYLTAHPILAGALMILVPGVTLTNCMRDFMANDFLAGTTKFAEASMTALATALGVAVVILGIYPLMGG